MEALRAIYEDTFSSQSEGVYKVCVCSEGLRVEMMVGSRRVCVYVCVTVCVCTAHVPCGLP